MIVDDLRKILVMVLCALVFATPVAAQECNITDEMIVRLRPASFGNRRAWDMLYGDVGYERFSDIAMIDDENVVVAGDYTVGEDDTVYKPMILQMNYRADTVWENREETNKDHPLIRVVKTDRGISALGEVTEGKKRGIFLSNYSKDGKLLHRKNIVENGADIEAVALVETHDKKGFIIGAQYRSQSNLEDTYGLIYKVTSQGNIVWRRAYRPGIVTFFHNIHAMPGGAYMASGQIRMEDGRLAGWGVKLDENGAIQWQQTYPRGSFAALRSAGVFRDGGYVFTGDVEPAGGGRKSAWVMVVNEVGKVVWQRYYTADYNYTGYDLIAHPDGRTDVLISGKPLKGRRDRPHLYVLTISPRGYLMNARAYVDGQGAGARRLILGPNKGRFFVGTAQTTAPDNVPLGARPPYTFDAWLVGLPALDPYEDPCMINPFDDIRPIDNDPF